MKKMISILLSMALAVGFSSVAMADSLTTEVSYTANGTETFRITVPERLAPGESGEVSLSGTWPSYKTVRISAPGAVTLTNSIDNAETDLAIDFAGIAQAGSNTTELSVSESVAVENFSAKFGVWTGAFDYTVDVTYAAVEPGASLSNTSWKFNETLTGYENVFGTFDFDAQTGWEEFPDDCTISNGTVSYNFWGFSITDLNGIKIFGPVQSISEPQVFGYTPAEVFGIQPGWYLIDGNMLTQYLNGLIGPEAIVAGGLVPSTAPVITITEPDPSDYASDAEYQEVVASLQNSAVIAWLRQNAAVQ